jgi:hypothetical protein
MVLFFISVDSFVGRIFISACVPQGLKPLSSLSCNGTAEAVP